MKESKFSKVRAYWNKPGHAAYLFIAPAMLIIFLFVEIGRAHV